MVGSSHKPSKCQEQGRSKPDRPCRPDRAQRLRALRLSPDEPEPKLGSDPVGNLLPPRLRELNPFIQGKVHSQVMHETYHERMVDAFKNGFVSPKGRKDV